MELTRRNAILTVVAGGVGTSAALSAASAVVGDRGEDGVGGTEVTDRELRRLRSLAEVVYPSEVSFTDGFVSGYLQVQLPDRRASIREAGRRLDEAARRRYGSAFADLSSGERDTLLRELGVDRAQPNPDGRAVQRIRYYLVNGLLYALFTDPKGGKLVGIDNPRGYPGGYESYAEDPTT